MPNKPNIKAVGPQGKAPFADNALDYTILLAPDASSLSSQVNRLIRHGWQPQGGVALAVSGSIEADEVTELWAQSMVKPA